MQAATQAPAGTVRDQLDMSNAQVTKNDMMRSVMPGVQMKAARDSQAMQRQAMGVPSQPAPNIRMADGGIVGYKDGGLLDRIMNYIRSIEFGGTSREADQYNREVMEALNQRDIGRRVETPSPMPRPDDRAPRAAVSGPSTRAEKFSQMFPKAREYVNQGGGSTMGGLQYLQMVGRKQQEAKEEEARRAANYIKMLARSQDMIDEVDPANTLPPEITAFFPGGGVEGRRTARNRRRGQSNVVDEEPRRIGRGRVLAGGIGAGGDPVTDSLGQMGRNRKPEPEVMAEEVAVAPTPVQPKDEQEFITDPSLGDVLLQLQTGPVRPQDRAEPEEKKGIFDNVDIGRLQAFLAGGAGQRSTAEALGGGLRGLMAEDQRRETLASDEAIETAKIAAERYGAQLDYDAALAGMDADLRDLVTKAELDAIRSFDEDKRQLARESLDAIRGGLDDQFNNEVTLLRDQYENDPEALARELNAATNQALKRRVRIATEAGGGATGTFSTNIEDVTE